jgi:hypothetical protein
MTKARDISKLLSTANGKIAGASLDVSFENISDSGTAGTKVASGTTGQRGSTAGQIRFNTTTGLAEYYTGSEFKLLDSPPTISSVSPSFVNTDTAGNITFTISGSNFQSGAVVKFIANDATELTASTVTVTNSTSISAVIARSSFINAKEPYDIKVINISGLFANLDNQINVDLTPAWSTASGSLGTFLKQSSVSVSVLATDADSDAITYSVASGTLPTGLSLNSSTGAITGTAPNVASDTTNTFTLRATANGVSVDREFSITTSLSFTARVLVVGGGSSGTSGHSVGGAGGEVIDTNITLRLGSSTIVNIGDGGGGGGFGSNSTRNNGQSSYITANGITITARGGDTGGSAGTEGGTGAYNINFAQAGSRNGANGVISNITGSNTYYGGGGGGAGGAGYEGSAGGIGGLGGGGGAGTGRSQNNWSNATANTGGGGGGGGVEWCGTIYCQSSSGGSGIIIVRYTSASQRFTGGTVTQTGGDFIHTFTSSTTITL